MPVKIIHSCIYKQKKKPHLKQTQPTKNNHKHTPKWKWESNKKRKERFKGGKKKKKSKRLPLACWWSWCRWFLAWSCPGTSPGLVTAQSPSPGQRCSPWMPPPLGSEHTTHTDSTVLYQPSPTNPVLTMNATSSGLWTHNPHSAAAHCEHHLNPQSTLSSCYEHHLNPQSTLSSCSIWMPPPQGSELTPYSHSVHWWSRASCPWMLVDISGTNCDQCWSVVQCCFTSMETIGLNSSISALGEGRPPNQPRAHCAHHLLRVLNTSHHTEEEKLQTHPSIQTHTAFTPTHLFCMVTSP